MKKIIILKASGNELANQLWNYTSIYAYSLEKKYSLRNPSFFEYGEYFNMTAAPSGLFRILFFKPFKNYTKRKTAPKRKAWRKMYTWYTGIEFSLHRKKVIASGNNVYYMAPTKGSSGDLAAIEKSRDNVYFDGWLFRNPVGLEKYRGEIREYFKPRHDIQALVASTMDGLRKGYEKVIGVHIRQGDYKIWRGGEYFVEQKRVREIIDDYVLKFGVNTEKTCFFIASDGSVDSDLFSGLHIVISKNNAVTDLFSLAATDVVIGSNSTFGAFASYYGNISFIVMQKEKMNWEYYSGKTAYFENKYSTFVNY